jgi:hypothetical protein
MSSGFSALGETPFKAGPKPEIRVTFMSGIRRGEPLNVPLQLRLRLDLFGHGGKVAFFANRQRGQLDGRRARLPCSGRDQDEAKTQKSCNARNSGLWHPTHQTPRKHNAVKDMTPI